jgi:hypothetical protein
VSNWDVQWVEESEGLNTVEGSAPCELEEKPTCSITVRRAGNVGAPAAMDRLTLNVETKKKVKELERMLDVTSRNIVKQGKVT